MEFGPPGQKESGSPKNKCKNLYYLRLGTEDEIKIWDVAGEDNTRSSIEQSVSEEHV